MSRILLSAVAIMIVWASLFAYSSLGRQIYASTELLDCFHTNMSQNPTFYTYGWPLVHKTEMVRYSDDVFSGVIRSTIELHPTNTVEKWDSPVFNFMETNQFFWMLILFFVGINALRWETPVNGLQFSLGHLLVAITCIAIFIVLTKWQFRGFTWLFLIPISYGVYCCIVEPLRLLHGLIKCFLLVVHIIARPINTLVYKK